MTRKYRLTFICISLFVLLFVGRAVTGEFEFIVHDFWFTSGLLLLVLLSLIDQPHFSKDSNIFVNAIVAGVSLLLVQQANRDPLFWLFLGVSLYLAISSYTLLWIRQRSLTEEPAPVRFFARLNREIGKPEALFSAFFVWGAAKQFGVDTKEFNALLLYWIVFMILNIPALAGAIADLFEKHGKNHPDMALGQIFGVQSKNTFLVKLFPAQERSITARIFDFVEFKYSADGRIRKGLLLDTYLLDQEQWVKVLANNELEKIFGDVTLVDRHTPDVVYKITDIPNSDFLNRFVGIVTDNSRINRIRFIYNSKIEISEGQLLQVSVNAHSVLYQIVEGITKIETLEQKNQTGLIIGEALQLGTWNLDKQQFEQFGWVPWINSPVFLASDIDEPSTQEHECTSSKHFGQNS